MMSFELSAFSIRTKTASKNMTETIFVIYFGSVKLLVLPWSNVSSAPSRILGKHHVITYGQLEVSILYLYQCNSFCWYLLLI